MKVARLLLAISFIWAGIAFGAVSYERVDDASMTIIQESRVSVSRSDLEQRKVDLEKALVEINALLGEADKLGITKVNDV